MKQAALAKGHAKGLAEGRAEGHAEGREQERIEIARNALEKSFPIDVIHELTGLDLETLKNLQK